jgi:hypothetical protein
MPIFGAKNRPLSPIRRIYRHFRAANLQLDTNSGFRILSRYCAQATGCITSVSTS